MIEEASKSDSGHLSSTPNTECKQPSLTHKLSTSSSTSSPKNDSQPPTDLSLSYPFHVSPGTIPGILHFNNNGAIDWSVNGLIAYGCQNHIVIVEQLRGDSLKYSQTLHRHKHVVCHVKWAPPPLVNQLASVDISGVIIIFNLLDGSPLTVILASNDTKVVSFFHWIYLDKNSDESCISNSLNLFDQAKDESQLSRAHEASTYKSSTLPKSSFLLAFYQQSSCFLLYDTELGEPIVKWHIESKVSHIAFNPFFTFNRSCDSSVYNLLLGFKTSRTNDEKLYLGLARLNESDFQADDSSKEPKKLKLAFATYVLQSSVNDFANAPNSPRSLRYDLITRLDPSIVSQHLANWSDFGQSNNTNESYIQLEFHKSVRNQIFIVFPRDIYLVDLSIETIINVIPLERNCSKLVKIFSCAGRNSFYAFHEIGNVSFRLYQKKVIHDRSILELPGETPSERNSSPRLDQDMAGTNQASFLNVGYINLCQSEPIRLTKQNKIFGYALSPFDETRVAFLLSSGRIVIKSLICQKVVQAKSDPVSMGYIVNQTVPMPCLSDLIKPQEYQLGAFLLSDYSSDQQKPFDSIYYKILSTHFIGGLNSLPTVVRMCPPLTLMNIRYHKPLLAVGDSLGLIQIWLLHSNTCTLHREFSVHSYPVAGIEWTSLTSLISFSYPTINSPSHTNHSSNLPFSALSTFTGSGSSSGRVTNELYHINIETGKISPFRANRLQDSSPIETVRVSHLKQYLIILFKNEDPFEIWDVKNLTLLRVMPKNLSNITAVEWSPLYNKKQVPCNSENSDSDISHSASNYSPIKENFIVTNRNLFHFSIEGNLVREMSCIPPDSDSGHVNVTSIAWKSDQVLLGDASGTLNIWHLKRKISATEPSYRGYIRKIRFGPGRGNMKCLILYADSGVDIWDINEFRVCAQLKHPRDMNFRIIDVDWASCDLPVLCTADGSVVVTDTKLKTFSSSIGRQEVTSAQLSQLFLHKDTKRAVPLFCLNIDSSFNFLTLKSKKEILLRSIFPYPNKSANELKGEEDEKTSDGWPQFDICGYIRWQINLAKVFASQTDLDFWSILDSILYGKELDSRLDMFLDEQVWKRSQQEKLLQLESNRKTYSHACHAYQLNLRLKNFQRAVQILLESESHQQFAGADSKVNSDNVFYVDALKACLIASLQSDLTSDRPSNSKAGSFNRNSADGKVDHVELSDNDISVGYDENSEASSTKGTKDAVAPVVKLVATSLIANGHTLEGVELLNFISKTADSCRYLQSSDKWLDSIWLAKSSLDTNECTEVIRRWCEQLISSKYYSDQQTAIKMYLSRRQFSRVLRNLNRLLDFKAFPFALICVAAQLIDIDDNQELLEQIFDAFVSRFFGFNEEQLVRLKMYNSQIVIESGGDSVGEQFPKSFGSTEYEETLRQCWSMFQGKLSEKLICA